MKFPNTPPQLQALMLFVVLLPLVYLAIKNNSTELVGQLAALAFGYYFGKDNSTLPPEN